MKSPSELTEAVRAQGLKVTPQRQLLFSLLTDLVAMGGLHAVALGAGAMRFDPDVDDHHHGNCASCAASLPEPDPHPDNNRVSEPESRKEPHHG